MALPEKVIERLGREPVRTPGWSSRMLMLASIIFILSLFVYVGMAFLYQPQLKGRLKALENEIQRFSQEVPRSDQVQLIAFYSQVANIQGLLDEHIVVSPLFSWLERHTHTNIFFSRLGLNTQSNQLTLSGVARSSQDVAEQMKEFQDQPEVKEVNAGNLNLNPTGSWQFDVTLVFHPNFLRQAP